MTIKVDHFISNFLKKNNIYRVFKLNPKLLRSIQNKIKKHNIDIDEKQLDDEISEFIDEFKKVLSNKNFNFASFFKKMYNKIIESYTSSKSNDKSQYGGRITLSKIVNNIKLLIVLTILINTASANVEINAIDATEWCRNFGVVPGSLAEVNCPQFIYAYNLFRYWWVGPPIDFETWLQWNNFKLTLSDDLTNENHVNDFSILIPDFRGIQGLLSMSDNPRYTPPVPNFDRVEQQERAYRQRYHPTASIQMNQFPEALRRQRASEPLQLPAPQERLLLPRPPQRSRNIPLQNLGQYLPAPPEMLLLPSPQQAEYMSAMGFVLLLTITRIFSPSRLLRIAEGQYGDGNEGDDDQSYGTSSSNTPILTSSNTLTEILGIMHATNEEEEAVKEYGIISIAAATRIQSVLRGNQTRSRLTTRQRASTRIQKMFRGDRARRSLKRPKMKSKTTISQVRQNIIKLIKDEVGEDILESEIEKFTIDELMNMIINMRKIPNYATRRSNSSDNSKTRKASPRTVKATSKIQKTYRSYLTKRLLREIKALIGEDLTGKGIEDLTVNELLDFLKYYLDLYGVGIPAKKALEEFKKRLENRNRLSTKARFITPKYGVGKYGKPLTFFDTGDLPIPERYITNENGESVKIPLEEYMILLNNHGYGVHENGRIFPLHGFTYNSNEAEDYPIVEEYVQRTEAAHERGYESPRLKRIREMKEMKESKNKYK